MDTYKSTVTYTSQNISKKMEVILKDLTGAEQLDALTNEGNEVHIKPKLYAEISVHNEHSQDKDYKKYVILDEDGTKYVTGSESFWRSFTEIMEDMAGVDEEWELVVTKQPSKNYKGKGFLTCYVI